MFTRLLADGIDLERLQLFAGSDLVDRSHFHGLAVRAGAHDPDRAGKAFEFQAWRKLKRQFHVPIADRSIGSMFTLRACLVLSSEPRAGCNGHIARANQSLAEIETKTFSTCFIAPK